VSNQYYDIKLQNLPKINAVKELDYNQSLAEVKEKINAENIALVDDELKPLLQEAQLLDVNGAEFWVLTADENKSRYALDLPLNALARTVSIAAWYRALGRQEVNEGVRAVMIATATGSDLDNRAFGENLTRLDGETDDAFRKRIVLYPESLGTGTGGSYEFYAISADDSIKQAEVTSPNPCEITIYLLSNQGNGSVQQEIQDKVLATVLSPNNHALGDDITVNSVEIVEYNIDVDITFYQNINENQVITDIVEKYQEFKQKTQAIAHPIDLFHINSLFCHDSIQQININAPLNVVIGQYQAPFCTKLTINGVDVA